MNKPYVIGITGGSASGKTLFLEKLLAFFEPHLLCLVSQDHYYKPLNLQPRDELGVPNFDTPESIDFNEYASDIGKIRSGKSVTRLEYTFNNPNRIPKLLTFDPAPIVLVEGIFVLYYQELADLLDLKLFIDAKDHIKIKRRILRDKVERGYDLDDVLYRYEKHVMPTYERFIEPFKHDADLIVPNNRGFDRALEVIKSHIQEKLSPLP